ncbi:acyl carrier protein [Anaerocolumna sp. AGMB13025]|uniref:acyl carrier protein n=1 Tax=Anaerocolumna sp. AGMB13025 TaxID=3039116 RepID=UPI00241FE434|nr:acyl carrier protein [Anaerocolumna sp. AGMB13025]WFR56028.1 acyl carrier protein [Anaerocolumna sp. AGMB13025]
MSDFNQESIRAKVRKFIQKYSKKDDIEDSQNLFEMSFANSLFAMQLILFIENEFELAVASEDIGMDNFDTVDKICSFIQSKMQVA